jgi:hypothetical protein
VSDRCGIDLSAACILHGHREAELHGRIADQFRFGDSAYTRDLDGNGVGCAVGVCLQKRREIRDRLVQHQGSLTVVAQGAAFFVRRARLLEIIVEVPGGAQKPACLVR